MEKLDMYFCDVLGRAQLHSETLTSLVMSNCMLLDEVDIWARNLQNFGYVHNPQVVKLNYSTFKYIRRLLLLNIDVDFGVLLINSSNFPALVSLKVGICMNMEQLMIASNKLESLDVCRCKNLEYCMIVAPQLLSFTYSGQVVHMDRLVASRKLCVALILKEPYGGHTHIEKGFVEGVC
ncbi:hypothetical protein PHJA_000767000 [Phtheirospermum japonicum]|uniref:At1g61320/AtMIF1 LRR domain-containing protein n=1 Tax=Phtheirospermum japonicum TaxID=374723 RepID=A0A830BJ58_9LAMI|nr:hypothetical protein PHJA_000767000 [Phtheirospermum japonicum]